MARAIWSGSISFGMVSIPVKLYGATESKDIRFHLLHAKDGTRLKQIRWCPTDEAEVPWNETARGYEYSKGKYVVLTDEDFQKLPLPSRHTIDISEEDVKAAEQRVIEAAELLKKRDFTPRPEKGKCLSCDVKTVCGAAKLK